MKIIRLTSNQPMGLGNIRDSRNRKDFRNITTTMRAMRRLFYCLLPRQMAFIALQLCDNATHLPALLPSLFIRMPSPRLPLSSLSEATTPCSPCKLCWASSGEPPSWRGDILDGHLASPPTLCPYSPRPAFHVLLVQRCSREMDPVNQSVLVYLGLHSIDLAQSSATSTEVWAVDQPALCLCAKAAKGMVGLLFGLVGVIGYCPLFSR